jgi:hypothetical protein
MVSSKGSSAEPLISRNREHYLGALSWFRTVHGLNKVRKGRPELNHELAFPGSKTFEQLRADDFAPTPNRLTAHELKRSSAPFGAVCDQLTEESELIKTVASDLRVAHFQR